MNLSGYTDTELFRLQSDIDVEINERNDQKIKNVYFDDKYYYLILGRSGIDSDSFNAMRVGLSLFVLDEVEIRDAETLDKMQVGTIYGFKDALTMFMLRLDEITKELPDEIS